MVRRHAPKQPVHGLNSQDPVGVTQAIARSLPVIAASMQVLLPPLLPCYRATAATAVAAAGSCRQRRERREPESQRTVTAVTAATATAATAAAAASASAAAPRLLSSHRYIDTFLDGL